VIKRFIIGPETEPSSRQRQESTVHELSEKVTTAQLSDALDTLGRRDRVMGGAIVPLVRGTRVLGRAATVQFAPVDHDEGEPYTAAIDFIDSLQSGELVVIATGDQHRSAFWGELFSAAAIGRGATGVVCDGYLRDTPKISALGFPAFGAGTRPIDFRARMEITGTARPVMCGGVLVTPGELVLADDDGVVVVPSDIEPDVVQLANDKASRETVVLEELQAGATLESVWARYRVL
jgi:regulator of RNase E activity RraA